MQIDIFYIKGRCAYNGPKYQTKTFFNNIGYPCKDNYNPADHYIWETSVIEGQEQLCRSKISSICNQYESSEIASQVKKSQLIHVTSDPEITRKMKETSETKVGFIQSFLWLLWRSLIAQYRDKSTFIMKFVQNIVLALIIGLLYLRVPWSKYSLTTYLVISNWSDHENNASCLPYDSDANENPYTEMDAFNINGAIFSSLATFSFTYLFVVVFAFPQMQTVLRKEYYDGMYHLLTAFLAETVSGLPFLLTMPGLFGMNNSFSDLKITL